MEHLCLTERGVHRRFMVCAKEKRFVLSVSSSAIVEACMK